MDIPSQRPPDTGSATTIIDRLRGVLLGTALGDSLGLPFEGMRPARVEKRFDGLRQRLVFGRGLISDDTEQTILVARAWLRSGGDADRFAADLAGGLRWWFASLPPGIGLGTGRACLKLWLVPWAPTGVRSAGNGAAMRVAVLGVVLADDAPRRRAVVRRAAEITHRDPRAVSAALAVAEVAAWAMRGGPVEEVLRHLADLPTDDATWPATAAAIARAVGEGHDIPTLLRGLGADPARGVSGYAPHSVAVAIATALRCRGDARAAAEAILRAGGDTDTVAAIALALCGAWRGADALPMDLVAGIRDWPRGVPLLERLATALAARGAGQDAPVPSWCWPATLPRNLLVLLIALAHGFRRLLPG